MRFGSGELFETLEPLIPIDFFNIGVEIRLGKKLTLPDTSDLLGEDSFAEVSLCLQKEEVVITALIKKPFEESVFPDFDKGDSLELFLDTRDLKTSGFMNRFCHHFLILPVVVNGIASHEITHFRTEDSHPLCDPLEIEVRPDFASTRYQLEIVLPASCLHGYDPTSFNRLGFTYRINRHQGQPQHFSVSSRDFNIAQHPSLWASFNIKS